MFKCAFLGHGQFVSADHCARRQSVEQAHRQARITHAGVVDARWQGRCGAGRSRSDGGRSTLLAGLMRTGLLLKSPILSRRDPQILLECPLRPHAVAERVPVLGAQQFVTFGRTRIVVQQHEFLPIGQQARSRLAQPLPRARPNRPSSRRSTTWHNISSEAGDVVFHPGDAIAAEVDIQ